MAETPASRTPLAGVRSEMTADVLSVGQRALIADQAMLLVDGFYAHLWQKRALYGVDPIRRLQLLRRRVGSAADAEFHAELRDIMSDLQDLHTLYQLPLPYAAHATLGFLLERCWVGEELRWVASHVRADLLGSRSKLGLGAEITHWNGMPIAVAVARHAEREPGSNTAARLARGLDSMTQRFLAISPVPDEDWVDLRFTVDGSVREARIAWQIVDFSGLIQPDDWGTAGPGRVAAPRIGIDRRTQVVQDLKKALFAGRRDDPDDDLIPTEVAGVLARKVTTPSGRFGQIRIHSFLVDPEALIAEIARLVEEMPRDGIILDIRGNPGGAIVGAEGILQLFTHRRIQPEPFQLISTEETAAFCREVPDFFGEWAASIDESLALGAQHSSAIPISTDDWINDLGQRYHGPVVLVVDALCYSASDMFAAGFQDHEIGLVLGVDGNTGAGGATVQEQAALLFSWPGSPFEPLPAGAALTVSIARSLRVGRHAGQPLEDLGVVPDELHKMTSRDLLEDNVDLLARAGELLAKQPRRRLDAGAKSRGGSTLLTMTTENITSVDVYVDGRPVRNAPVANGRNEIDLPVADHRAVRIRIEGFDGDERVAARDLNPDD